MLRVLPARGVAVPRRPAAAGDEDHGVPGRTDLRPSGPGHHRPVVMDRLPPHPPAGIRLVRVRRPERVRDARLRDADPLARRSRRQARPGSGTAFPGPGGRDARHGRPDHVHAGANRRDPGDTALVFARGGTTPQAPPAAIRAARQAGRRGWHGFAGVGPGGTTPQDLSGYVGGRRNATSASAPRRTMIERATSWPRVPAGEVIASPPGAMAVSTSTSQAFPNRRPGRTKVTGSRCALNRSRKVWSRTASPRSPGSGCAWRVMEAAW